MSVCTICISASEGHEKVVNTLELELESLLAAMWVLGLKLGSSGKVISALNHCTIFKAMNGTTCK